ncbi:phenylacetate--CoA ligase family protein [Geoalkalibacter halelectricus]|uniref:AMP-binding protein n=1 Tax=Geoalkalibacter halelectricus TaxID=2847045 RepID=A0ABY5ZLB3_9BACT|nr:AMP-binding protein [Geoalkalibacter halelectricus]MDO3379810.1 AMP-binding protein [Geoalkalibacter halelectricus]UWZ79244.1 AMP-binding protein [Geoalkalibacter halelectricus]
MQNALLRRHVTYLAGHSPYYRQAFAAAGVAPSQVQSISDLARFPLTSKDDLALHHETFHCVPPEEFVDLCLTSGTTGKPVALPQTFQDLGRVGFNEEMSFRIAGIGRGDRVLVAAAMDRCFMAGLAYFLGLNRVGALAIRGGSSSINALAELVRDHRPTAVVGVPTLLLRLAEALQSRGSQPVELGVERLICIGEPVRRADLSLSVLGRRLTEVWGAKLFGTYACTEMATAFTDCEAGCGGHVIPELIIVEIIDERGEVLPPGHIGEVVVTPLQVKGMPLLRFRTGDMAALHCEPCSCGRNTWRLGPILGRRAQMLKYRGTTLFPSAIFRVLEEIDWIRGYYIEVFNEFELSDRVRIVVGSADAHADAAAVADRIAARIRVKPEVSVVSPEDILEKTLQPDKRKPVMFFDYRETTHKGNE